MAIPTTLGKIGTQDIHSPYYELGRNGFDDLATAITTISTTAATLLIPSSYGAVAISGNTTIPANIHLKIEKGSYFDIATGGIVLTVAGTIEAGLYRIFAWAGASYVKFTGPIKEVYPEWWGAVGDGSTDDILALNACTAAATNYVDSNRDGKAVIKLTRFYAVSTTWSFIDINKIGNLTVQGLGKKTSGIIGTTACADMPVMECVGAPIYMRDFCICGVYKLNNVTAPLAAPSVALLMAQSVNNGNTNNFRLREIGIYGFFRYGAIYNYACADNTFDHCMIQTQGITDGEYAFHIAVISSSYTRPFTQIVNTNGTWATDTGGAENNKFLRVQFSYRDAGKTKATGSCIYYALGTRLFIQNNLFGGEYDYQVYSKNTSGLYLYKISGDGHGNEAAIYLCSDSEGANYPNCSQTPKIRDFMHGAVGIILKTDEYTCIVNGKVEGLSAVGTDFYIELNGGMQHSKIIDVYCMKKFKVAGQFDQNEVMIPKQCFVFDVTGISSAKNNLIHDNRIGGDTWIGGNQSGVRLGFPGTTYKTPLFIGLNKIDFSASIPSAGSWVQGDVIYNTGAAAGGSPAWSCIISNTFGSLTGPPTGSIEISTPTLTVSAIAEIEIGDVLDVAGAIEKGVVLNIDEDAKTITLNKNATDTVAGANVTWHNELSANAFKAWSNIIGS